MKALSFLLFLLSFTLDVVNGDSGNIVNSAIIESQALKGVPIVTTMLSQEAVPLIIVEDDLVVLDARGSLYLLDSNNLSDLKWKLNLTTKGYIRASLLYHENYILCTIENLIYRIDPKKGEIIWNKELKAPVRGKVAMLNGILTALTIDNYLYAINVKDGSLIWSYQGSQIELAKLSSASPVDKDGTVVVPFSSGNVVAFSEYGEKLWEYKLPSAGFLDYPFTDVIVALRMQGEKVIVINRFCIFALNLSSGDKIWSKTLSVKAISKVTENSVFIITNDNKVKALNLQDGYSTWTSDLSNAIKINDTTYFSEPVFTHNKLFITTNQGALIELNPSNGMIEKVISIPKGVYATLVFSDFYFYIITINNGLFKMRNVYE